MRFLLATLFAFYALSASALELPVDVEADALDVYQSKNQAVFSGNVKVVHGGASLGAGRVEVNYDAEGDGGISNVVAESKVVIVHGENTATGDKAVYSPKTEAIELTGNVILSRDGSVLKGEKLVYNLKTGQMRLANETKGGRVKASFSLKGN